MHANCLWGKDLPPPFGDGGLWRSLGVLLPAVVRHYPPKASGGDKPRNNKHFGGFRHAATEIGGSMFGLGGLRTGLKESFTNRA